MDHKTPPFAKAHGHRWTVFAFTIAGFVMALCAPDLASAQGDDNPQLLPPIGTSPAELPPPVGIADAPVGAPVPMDEGVIVESYEPWWTQPTGWFSGPIWEYGGELGINGSSGNAEAFSVLASVYGKRSNDISTFDWNLKYGKSSASGVETQHFALWNSRWDYNIDPFRFWYFRNTLEYDEFKAFDVRLALSAGYGHHFVKNDMTTFTGRIGAGASREFGGPDENWVPEANLGLDFEHKINDRQRVKLVVDYYPSWENFRDYRLVSDGFWEIMLNDAGSFSLKIGALDRYDSTPNGAKHNDIDYYVTLLWKI